MITLDGGQQAVIDGQARGFTYLVDLEFLSGTQYFTPYSTPIAGNGHTYTALGSILSIPPIRESENLTMDKLSIGLSIVDTGILAYVIGPATEYRGRAVRIYMQLINASWAPVQLPVLRWSGVMDKVRIERRPSKDGSSAGTIEMACIRAGLSRFRKGVGLRMTHEQQQQDYPGDLGLEYTESLITHSPVWLSKAFQKI